MSDHTSDQQTATARVPSVALILVAGSFITAVSLGARSTMGIFNGPITEDLGITTATFGLTVAIQNIVWGVSQPIAGAIADRFGSARVLIVGAVIYGMGLALMAQSSTGFQLHLTGGLVLGIGLGAASFSVVLSSIGRLVPPERRSTSLGIATAFGSGGQFVLVPLVGYLIRNWTWSQAMTLLAVVAASIVLATRPIRSRPTASGQAASPEDDETLGEVLGRAFRHRSYLLLNLGFFVCGFHVTFIGVHLPKYVSDLGQSGGVGDWALSLIGLFNIAGAAAAGVMGQRFRKTHLLSAIYFGRGLAITALLVLPASPATSLVFASLMGLFWLSTVPLTSGIVMGQFGLKHAGSLFGLVFLSHQVGAFIGVYGGGYARDASGSYEQWWWLSVVLALGATAVHFFIDEGPASSGPSATAPSGGTPGLRRPRLRPALGTVVLFGGLAGFAVLTHDGSVEGVEARSHSVVCFLWDPGDEPESLTGAMAELPGAPFP